MKTRHARFTLILIFLSLSISVKVYCQCTGNCKDGRGVYIFKSGDRYEGDWKNSLQNGTGKYYFANGAVYEGQWFNGKSHGFGKRTSKDGSYYEGDFLEGEETGQGRYVSARGTVKKGKFINGKLNGYGSITFKTGDRYEGNFVNDKTEGTGIYYYANGDRFEGEFKENLQTGRGVLYYAKGGTLRGIWNRGEYQSGSNESSPPETQGIQLIKNPLGVFETTVVVNGIQKLEMIFDTGVPEVRFAPDMVLKLIQTKAITSKDLLSGGAFTDAKGHVINSVRFGIKELNVGGYVVKDVVAGVSNSTEAVNVLGLNALEKMGKLEIDFRKKIVTTGN